MTFEYALCPSFREANCDNRSLSSGYKGYRQTICKQATQKFDNKRVDCKKLNDTKHDEKYEVKFSNRSRALEKSRQ